jgi:Kef-type K+ transport system membrane component KefB
MMAETAYQLSELILVVGTTVIIAMIVKPVFDFIGFPSLVGFIVLGFFIGLADKQFGILADGGRLVYDFLARIGIIVLLFRVGLESNIAKLFKKLRIASIIWVGDVVVSGVLAFIVSYYLLRLPLLPSLFISSALTATSVGVAVGVWQEAGAIRSSLGEVLIDVAELDDISGIFLMALLFGIAPIIYTPSEKIFIAKLTQTAGILFVEMLTFGTFCLVFSFFFERAVLAFFQRIQSPADFMLLVAGIGMTLAALAGMMGLSIAVGAFFAGLVFSPDPNKVKVNTAFIPIHDLFQPFFFIGIGLNINPGTLVQAVGLGVVLLVVAVIGKLIGNGGTTMAVVGWREGVLMGVSMFPRAEIALIIMQRGLNLGEWAVPSHVFSAMVFVSAATAIGSPLFVRPLLEKWPQKE